MTLELLQCASWRDRRLGLHVELYGCGWSLISEDAKNENNPKGQRYFCVSWKDMAAGR